MFSFTALGSARGVWRDVLNRLRSLGHTATAPTLTGLGERRHVGNDSADLETHVEDVVAHIEMEDLRDITLLGWSYGGMVVTGVLARIPERIKELVYLDAFVPEDGKAVADYWPPEVKEMMDTYRDRNAPLPAMPLTCFGVTDPEIAKFVEPRLTAQPWRTCYQPVKALKVRPAIPISYIVCTGWGETPFTARLAEMNEDPGASTTTLNASHLCMLTDVEATIRAIAGAGAVSQLSSFDRTHRPSQGSGNARRMAPSGPPNGDSRKAIREAERAGGNFYLNRP